MRLLTLLLLSVLASCGARQPAAPAQPEPAPVSVDTEKAIEGAVEQYRQAYEVSSLAALAELYSHDLDVVLVFQGRAHRGWSQVQNFLQKRLEGATKVRIGVTALSIQALGPGAAVATAELESTIGDDAATVTERGALSLVFRNIDDSWKVVAEHFSYPTGGA